jgi:hypothetical protein
MTARPVCAEPGCTGAHHARGLCHKHYVRALTAGQIDTYAFTGFKQCAGTWYHWECETGCRRRSFATFATKDEARHWRLIHEAGCKEAS